MRGKLRWKWLILLAVMGACTSAGWFFGHRYQMRRMNGVFLEQATRAEENGHADRAARFLRQYLLINRADVDTRIRYGILLENLANSPRALSDALGVFEQVLDDAPTRADVRRRAANLSVKLGRADAALHHLNELNQRKQTDADTDLLMGDCYAMKKDFSKAQVAYRKVTETQPTRTDAYLRLAELLRGPLKKPEEAEKVLDKLVETNAKSSQAYLVRASFRQTTGTEADLPRAEEDLRRARDLLNEASDLQEQGPKLLVDVLLVSGMQRIAEAVAERNDEAKKRQLNEAREFLQLAAKKQEETQQPTNYRIYLQLARAEEIAGRRDKAIEVLSDAQKKVSGSARTPLLWELAELYIDQDPFGKADESGAEQAIAQLRKMRVPSARIDLLEAKVLAKKGDWYKAASKLEDARFLLTDEPKLAVSTDLLLGRCYEQMGYVDRQLAVYRRAIKLDPLTPAPRFGATVALINLGLLDEAVEECQRLVEMPKVPAAGRIHLARLMIMQNLGLSQTAQRWDLVMEIVDRAAKANPDAAEPEVLRAEVFLARADAAKARAEQFRAREASEKARAEESLARAYIDKAQVCLATAKETFPQNVEPWIALAGLAKRDDKKADALNILQQASEKLGDRAELRLAKLRFMPSNGTKNVLSYLQSLAAKSDDLDRAAQARLLSALATAFDQAADTASAEQSIFRENAEQLLRRLVELEPNRLRFRLQLFDHYIRAENTAGMAATLEKIEDIEGPGGPLVAYGKARLLIWRANKGERGLTAEAHRYLQTAASKRPRWSRIPVALAWVAEIDGHSDLAIEHYQKAVQLGERDLSAIRPLLALLWDRERYGEADEVIHKLQQAGPISDSLQKLAAEISLFNQNSERALDLARNAVPEDSRNYEDHLWRGRILSSLGRLDLAERALKRAIELCEASNNPSVDPYVVLVQFYARTNRTDGARDVVATLRKRFSEDHLALGQCFEALGDNAAAEKHYEAVLAATPKDAARLVAVARHYQRTGQPKKAEPLLERLLKLTDEAPADNAAKAHAAEARRNLALTLGIENPTRDRHARAMDLIEENLRLPTHTRDDELVKGVLLASKTESRKDAIALLEKACKLRDATADQEFLLANLYFADGDWPKARRQMLHVVSNSKYTKHEKYAQFLGILIDRLLDRGEMGEAKLWAEKLRDVKPNDFATYAAWSRYHARRQHVDEALEECKKALSTVAVEQVVPIAVTSVATNVASAAQLSLVDGWVETALANNRGKLDLLLYQAVLRERQERFADAERLYREVLAKQPGNIAAANNLAFLLGLQRRGEEASRLMKMAISTVGSVVELLDSRAAIALAQGNVDDAARDIAEGLRQAKTASLEFHLAQARAAAGQEKQAAEAFEHATRLGLHLGIVHPLERATYQSLASLASKHRRN